MNTDRIQAALADANLDGWLFFDHHRRDPLAYRILGIPENVEPTRRWYYFVPASGEPRKLVHRIESGTLDSLPGEKKVYLSWADQQEKLASLLKGASRIAMQYSRNCAIPYVSLIDAGTVELVRGCSVEVVSSADLVQLFEARWSEDEFQSHLRAGKLVDQVRREAFDLAGERLRTNEPVNEYDVQQFIRRRFLELGLTTNHGPIVAANEHASDPHYEPSRDRNSQIRSGHLLLIDLWAKLMQPNAVYYDITWTGYCGEAIPSKMQKVFEVVHNARQQASEFVIRKASKREQFAGYEVDDVARGFISAQGFGEYFFHRTGHSIGTDVHGTGANMDNLESHDNRTVIPGTCFSIEPGIYLPEFGIRSEVNVYVGDGFAQVTGEEQEQLVRI